jgi:hypothetical protein
MSPLDSFLIGSPTVAAGIASFAWGLRCRLRWERGEGPHVAAYASFRSPPSAPGGWWMSLGIALGFVGAALLAPFVASL